jgi:hypothetical protein
VAVRRNQRRAAAFNLRSSPWRPRAGTQETDMRGLLLWLVGIPLPIIILLYLFGVL